jgi:hypothetical protein
MTFFQHKKGAMDEVNIHACSLHYRTVQDNAGWRTMQESAG